MGRIASSVGFRTAVVWGAIVVACVAVELRPASAHELSVSLSTLRLEGRQVFVVLTLNGLQIPGLDVNDDGFVSDQELDDALDRVYADVRAHYRVRSGEGDAEVTLERYEIVDDHLVRFSLRYVFEESVDTLEVTSRLDRMLLPDHRHLTSVTSQGSVHQAVLDAWAPAAVFTAGDGAWTKTAWAFLLLGVEHIFTGYDHLAFLLVLMIGLTRVGSLIKVVTSFTVAHSLTLGLATFDIVVIPERITESLIALSIAYVAVENLWDKPAVERHFLTFFFGLIHGFGFSGLLRDMELPRSNLALSLFSFNAGVEIGQVAFVLVFFPVVVYLGSFSKALRLRATVSLAIASIASFWFVQRAFLG